MLQIIDAMIEEGQTLAEKLYIPLGYEFTEDEECPRCHGDNVYSLLEPNEIGGVSGDYKCRSCGYIWGKI